MAQRLTQQRQIYYGAESTEGVEVLGTATEALLVSNLTLGTDQQFFPRMFAGAFGSRAGKLGPQPDPTLSFTVELRGAGASALPPEIDELLKTVFGARQLDDKAGTVKAIPTPTDTVFTIENVTGTTLTVGNAIAVETGTAGVYEVGWIASINTNEITLTHALTFTPATGKIVKPSLTFTPSNLVTPLPSLSFQVWLDTTNPSSRVSFLGCKGSVKLDMPGPGQIPTATFNFHAMSWAHIAGGTRPTPTYDSTVPPTSSKFKINATLTDVKNVSWDLGQTVARKMSQNSASGTFAQLVTNRDCKGMFQSYDVDDTQFSGWTAGTEFTVAQQFGNTLFNTMAYQMPKAQRSKVTFGDDNGLTTDVIDFQANITAGNDEVRLAYL